MINQTGKRIMLALDVSVIIVIALGAIMIYRATPYPTRQPAPLPACQAEDGGPYPCVWDGPSRGSPGGPGYRQGSVVTVTADD